MNPFARFGRQLLQTHRPVASLLISSTRAVSFRRSISSHPVTTGRMTIEQACFSQRCITTTLQSDILRNQLEGIKNSGADLITKWQSVLGLMLPLQIHAITMLGYGGNQSDLQRFQEDMSSLIQTESGHELREINDEKWAYILDVVFNTVPGKKLTTNEARNIASDLSNAMRSESFLTQVDRVIQAIPTANGNQKREQLLKILVPLHITVLSQHGFPGEAGYIQAQLSLMEHMADQVVGSNVMSATMTMFGRAGLL